MKTIKQKQEKDTVVCLSADTDREDTEGLNHLPPKRSKANHLRLQSWEELLPADSVVVPMEQVSQVVYPYLAWYLPTGHSTQDRVVLS